MVSDERTARGDNDPRSCEVRHCIPRRRKANSMHREKCKRRGFSGVPNLHYSRGSYRVAT